MYASDSGTIVPTYDIPGIATVSSAATIAARFVTSIRARKYVGTPARLIITAFRYLIPLYAACVEWIHQNGAISHA